MIGNYTYSPEVSKALSEASASATRSRHAYVEVEHLLMAFLKNEDPALLDMLDLFKTERERLRFALEGRLTHFPSSISPYSTNRVTTFSVGIGPRLPYLLTLAEAERNRTKANWIETAHILLAVTAFQGDPAADIFKRLGFKRDEMEPLFDKPIVEAHATHLEDELYHTEAEATEIPDDGSQPLTHFNPAGRARMVDVSEKEFTNRLAIAGGEVLLEPATLVLIKEGKAKKGDVLAVAQVAGIMAAKKTHELIPMCHPLPISGVDLRFEFDEERSAVTIEAAVKVHGQTGVEMEALTAVSVAALTIYDMVKATDKTMQIGAIRLLHKSGGSSGTFDADAEDATDEATPEAGE